MGGQAAEQIIAGVVLSERLAVTMYGAIHRAAFEGQRNQRGLVVDPKMLAEASFRMALTDNKTVSTVTVLEHPNIVPTVTVEDGGPDVVVVTRGVGRYVTVQDLIAAAKSNRGQGGKLPLPVAAAIGKSVVEALAAAHKAKVVHGAVHPRSVLVDEDGTIRLADFIVGRALTTAVAQGADSSLWRGLAGYLAPELVVGEEPTPAADVFACGAMLFTMLSGEAPPGTLHVTPAVERLVQRALDTDVTRRYKNASDLLDNLLEAFEDDRWEIAGRGEIIKAAGLSRADSNIDDATEDLLASLGSSAVNVTPMRPSMDARASEINARNTKTPTGANRLDALLADLDDSREHTAVDDIGFKRDPISELIQMDPRRKEAIVQIKPVRSPARVPSLDDPDEDEPPAPARDAARPASKDEAAALDAIAGLDEPVRRMSSAAEQATVAAEKLESAARRAEAAAKRVDTNDEVAAVAPAKKRVSSQRPVPKPNLPEIPEFADLPPPRLKSRALGIISLLVMIGGGVAFYYVYQDQKAKTEENKKKQEQAKLDAEAESKRRQNALKDKGSISYKVIPGEAAGASVWLKLGRSGPDFNTIPLTSSQMHRIRIELDGYQPVDTEVLAANWATLDDKDKDKKPGSGSGSGSAVGAALVPKKATVNITLKAVGKDKAGKSLAEPLPARPPNLAIEPAGFTPGEGPINIQTNPPGAEVWLLIGYGDTGMPFPTIAGRSYELRALMDGFNPGYASVTDEEWRDGGNPNIPLDEAPKKATIEKTIELKPDPDWVDPKKNPKKGK